jgi:predicted nuclease with TOPRIM domain
MQKIIDRYELKINEMQKQLESLDINNEAQRKENKRLNDELNDLIELYQTEMPSMKTDLKNLEDRLVYKFNDYWNELLEKLDKLDTRVSFFFLIPKTLIACISTFNTCE